MPSCDARTHQTTSNDHAKHCGVTSVYLNALGMLLNFTGYGCCFTRKTTQFFGKLQKLAGIFQQQTNSGEANNHFCICWWRLQNGAGTVFRESLKITSFPTSGISKSIETNALWRSCSEKSEMWSKSITEEHVDVDLRFSFSSDNSRFSQQNLSSSCCEQFVFSCAVG